MQIMLSFRTLGAIVAILLAMSAIASTKAHASEPEKFEVLGLKLGDTPADADAQLRKAGWRVLNERSYVIDGTDISFVAERRYNRTNEGQDEVKLLFSRPPVEPKLMVIERIFSPPSRQLLAHSTILGALITRNGPSVWERHNAHVHQMSWYDGPNAQTCAGFDANAIFNSRRGSPARSIEPKARDCDGILLFVSLGYQNKRINDAISMMSVRLYDLAEWKTDDIRFNAYASSIEHDRQKKLMDSTAAPEL